MSDWIFVAILLLLHGDNVQTFQINPQQLNANESSLFKVRAIIVLQHQKTVATELLFNYFKYLDPKISFYTQLLLFS